METKSKLQQWEANHPELQRLTVYLPRELVRGLKIASAQQGKSIRSLIEEYLSLKRDANGHVVSGLSWQDDFHRKLDPPTGL